MGNLLDASVWDGKLFNGEWVAATQTIEDDEPATGETLTRVGLATPEEVGKAAAAARAAQPAWAATDFEARAAVSASSRADGTARGGNHTLDCARNRLDPAEGRCRIAWSYTFIVGRSGDADPATRGHPAKRQRHS